MLSKPAPIALFVFGRPDHTKRTLHNLAANDLAYATDLIVFSDGPRNQSDLSNIAATRMAVNSAKGFKSIKLIEHSENIGLAKNIIQGVTQVLKEYERVIVMEDDILTSPHFLRFMNEALDRYQHTSDVWHINGWNYPVEYDGLPNAYLWRLMHCWGWATWRDRWTYFKKNPTNLIETWTAEEINSFNLDGSHDFWSQVLANERGDMNTWAVFWYSTIFQNSGLCLSPSISLTENIGLDGSGENCASNDAYQSKYGFERQWTWPLDISEMKEAVEIAKKYNLKINKATLPLQLFRFLRKILKHGGRR